MPRDTDDATPPLFGFELAKAEPNPESGRGGPPEPVEVGEAMRALGESMPRGLRLGTSSWSFPGWKGLVYAGEPGEQALARVGLAAYARHPLFRTVGVDKTFYRPAPRAEFERLAAQVPEGFSFLVKAWRGLVEHGVRAPGVGTAAGGALDAFLDAQVATRDVVAPVVEGLGAKAGPILFQFPPMRLAGSRATRGFLAALERFLGGLPSGPLYAVEVRNRALVAPDYAPRLGGLLAERGAVPCLTVHPTMPTVEVQSRELALDPSRPLVMRWMLRGNHAYDEAKDLYAPFDRVVEPDDAARDALARLAKGAIAAGLDAWIVVNNKAEGSSPLSVERLARAVVGPA